MYNPLWKCNGIKRISYILFIKQASEGADLTVTNPDMTRFMMSLDEAVNTGYICF